MSTVHSFCIICQKSVRFRFCSPNPSLAHLLSTSDAHISDKELIGIGSASLGLSSCFDAPFRMWKCAFRLFLRLFCPLSTLFFALSCSYRLNLTLPSSRITVTRHRKKYGPLYFPDLWHEDPSILPAGQGRVMRKMPRNWWHLDFSMWTYQIGLFFFAIPLAIAPAIPL